MGPVSHRAPHNIISFNGCLLIQTKETAGTPAQAVQWGTPSGMVDPAMISYTTLTCTIISPTILCVETKGCAVVLPAYPPDHDFSKTPLSESVNEGRPIHHLVSAPTMRIPTNISTTVNSYLAFRAVLRSGESLHRLSGTKWLIHITVLEYNRGASSEDKIHRVLCPGLGTAVGRMPYFRSAIQVLSMFLALLYTIRESPLLYSVQMRTAYDAVMYGNVEAINSPSSLGDSCTSHTSLCQVCVLQSQYNLMRVTVCCLAGWKRW